MTPAELKAKLTTEQITQFVSVGLEAGDYKTDNEGNFIFRTRCHNAPGEGSYKLYYYPESMMFHCYTECSASFDIYGLISKVCDCDFYQAFLTLQRYFGYDIFNGFEEKVVTLTPDWDILQRLDNDKTRVESEKLPAIQENILELFGGPAVPYEWLKEGITAQAMLKFGIRVDTGNWKIIIPHRDIDGRLIGIRGRSFDEIDLENGRKYMPICVEGHVYKHPLGHNLYGLFENKETIRRLKKVVVFEAEKSVLLCEGYYPGNNYSVACCGSSLSTEQIDLLLGLGVEKITLAFDRENDLDRNSVLTKSYESKLLKIIQPFAKYMDTNVVFDYNGLVGYKDSPADRGKETLERLLSQKIRINPITVSARVRKGSVLFETR